MHRQAHRVAQAHSVGSPQRHVHGDALGEVHLDRHVQWQVAGRQFHLPDVGDGHPGGCVDLQPHPDRDGQPVVQGQRQRAVLGGQRVGAARVDDADRAEKVVDCPADDCQALLGEPVAGVGRLGLAQRAQHVLAQRRGVPDARQPRALVGAQRGGQSPQTADLPTDVGGDLIGEPAPRGRVAVHRARRRRVRGGVGEHRRQRPRHRQARADGRGQRGQDDLRVIGLQVPRRRRDQQLDTRRRVALQGVPEDGAQRVLAAGGLRVVGEPDRQRRVEVGGDGGAGARAGQGGADRRVEWGEHHLRGHPPGRGVGAGNIACGATLPVVGGQVAGRDHDGAALAAEQVDRAARQWAVGHQRGPADGGDVQDAVHDAADAGGGDRAQPRVVDALQRVQVGLGIRQRRHAGPLGQRAQPVQPGDRRGLAGTGVRRGPRHLGGSVGRVGHHVAARHRVDGDQQVGVDGQAQRPPDGAVGVDVAAGGDLGRRQQDVQPAAGCQRGRQLVVDQPDRDGPARDAGGQPGAVGQGPQHGDPHRCGGVGGDGGVQVAGVVGRHPDHGQQEPRVVQAGGSAVVGRAVGVDQHGVDPGLVDAERGLGQRTQRRREREAGLLPALQFGGHRQEVRDRLVLVGVAVQRGAQARRGPDGRGVLEADHHIADGAVADVGDHAADGDDGLTRRGDHVRGDLIDADADERRGSRLARLRARRRGAGEHGETGQDGDHHREAHPAGPAESRRRHGPGPVPFFRPGLSEWRVREWVCGRRRGELGGSGGSAAGPSFCSLSISSSATCASRRSSA